MALATERLILRGWQSSDVEPFADLNADPDVMRYFPAVLSRAESEAMINRIKAHYEAHGFSLWAVEHRQSGQFIGTIGLSIPTFQAPFMPAIEVGWRLARPFWGQGFATEGAKAAMRHGFETLGLAEIVSFTATVNQRSMAVMQRLGMTTDEAENFDHPNVSSNSWLCRHVLYRIAVQDFQT